MTQDRRRTLGGRMRPAEQDPVEAPGAAPASPADPFAEIKAAAQAEAVRELGSALAEGEVAEGELEEQVARAIDVALAEAGTPLSTSDRGRLVREISDNILGYGPIEPFLEDDSVTEVMVNNHFTIYVERKGVIEETAARFGSELHLLQVIDRIVAQTGRRIDESSPMVDARLPDGSRVNAIIPPLAITGPSLTIRKFSREPADDGRPGRLRDDVAPGGGVPGGLRRRQAEHPRLGRHRHRQDHDAERPQLVHPDRERIITIEDAAELKLHQKHVIALEARPPNIEGKGQVAIRDLVRNALRMRPDRIVVGECRGAEAVDMLQAMNTGHDGSLTTIHANSPRDALARAETLVLTAGFDLPLKAIRDQISSAFDLIIHTNRLVDGRRRVTHISEVGRMEGEVITLQDLFVAQFVDDADGEHVTSKMVYTGIRPGFIEKLETHGVSLPKTFFGDTGAKVDVLRRGQRRSA